MRMIAIWVYENRFSMACLVLTLKFRGVLIPSLFVRSIKHGFQIRLKPCEVRMTQILCPPVVVVVVVVVVEGGRIFLKRDITTRMCDTLSSGKHTGPTFFMAKFRTEHYEIGLSSFGTRRSTPLGYV